MPASIATVLCLAGILGLFCLDRDRRASVSAALWIPAAWLCIAGSRMVSVWLQVAPEASADQYLEGSPLDRAILTGLLAAGILVLLRRAPAAGAFIRWNAPLAIFFLYCGLSVLWSEFPEVALKRWTKSLGDVVMVMVVLTDPNPAAALRWILARTAFVLIPLSVLLVKYYPDLGRGYNPWTWTSYYTGVATGKNGLGYVCLVFGLASVWRLLTAFGAGEPARGPRLAHGAIVAMTLWLFWKADSATSLTCFLLGSALLVSLGVRDRPVRRSALPLLGGSAAFLLVSMLLLGGATTLVEAMGRDTTLTGRTALWDLLLRMTVDPLLGTGFESFWLGERVERIWRTHWWHPNQAHNGYLELFLNLGIVGLALLAVVLVRGCRHVAHLLRRHPEQGRIRAAYLAAAVVYNLTEAAFKMLHPVGISFLLAVAAVPALEGDRDR